jgi:hypothetical protein
MTVMTSARPLLVVMPPLPVQRFMVDEYDQMISDYKASELVPFILDNRDLGPVAAQELLP